MRKEFQEQGQRDALEALGLEKQAFWSALRAMATSAGGRVAASRAGKALTPSVANMSRGGSQLRRGIGGFARGADRAVTNTVARGASRLTGALGGSRGTQAKVLKGTVNALKGTTQGAISSAGSWGLLSGGMGAAFAEDGQGWNEFKKGFGSGAASGALMGAAGGAVRNARRGHLRGLASRQASQGMLHRGAPETPGGKPSWLTPNQAAEAQLNQGVRATLKGTRNGVGPMGQAGNRADALGMGTQFGTEIMVPEMIMSHNSEAPAAPQPSPPVSPYGYPKSAADTSAESEGIPPRYVGSLIGSGAGGIAGRLATKGLMSGDSPKNRFVRGAIENLVPVVTGIGGAITGYTVGGHFGNPTPPPPIPTPEAEKQLEQIDFDKLLRYYKKKEDTGPGA